MKLEYDCRKIIEDEDFSSIPCNDGWDTIAGQPGATPFESWEKEFNTQLPGLSAEKVRALEIQITLSGISPDTETGAAMLEDMKHSSEIEAFRQLVLVALQAIFNHRNVVYMASKENKITALVLPFNRRVIDPTPYIDSRHPDQLKDKYKEDIENRLLARFPEMEVTGGLNSGDMKDRGYGEKLIKFAEHPPEYRKEYDNILPYYTKDVDAQIQTRLPRDRIIDITNSTLSNFIEGPDRLMFQRAQKDRSEGAAQELMEKVREYLERAHPEVQHSDVDFVMARINRAVYGHYVLDPLIDADEISDIMVLSYDNVRVKIASDHYTSNLKFLSPYDYERFVNGLAIRHGLDLSRNALNVYSDIDTNPKFRMRCNIATSFVTSTGAPYFHIRKIAKQKRGFDYLIKAGMLDDTMADYLIDRARNGPGMIFTGKGASGKTSLMNALVDKIPFNETALVIQESEELFSNIHPHIMFEHITDNYVAPELKGLSLGLQQLGKNGLLTDLNYFIIGEIKGDEARYFMDAADTGHKCWCSVHSPSSTDAIDKLSDFIMRATNHDKDTCVYMLKSLGTVIFMKDFKVCEISEIIGYDGNKKDLIYDRVYIRPGHVPMGIVSKAT